MPNYQTRKEVPNSEKWDLTFLLDGHTLNEQIAKLVKILKDLITIKISRYQQLDLFITALKKEDEATILANKILNYLANWCNENISDPQPNQLLEEFEFQMYQLEAEKGPELPRIFAYEKQIRTYLKTPALKPYVSYYERIFRTKKHQLPPEIQKFRTITLRGDINTINPFSILTDTELHFEPAYSSENKKHVLNHSTYQKLMKSPDAKLRKSAMDNYQQAYLNVKQTLANFLYQHFKKVTIEAKITKHDSPIAYLLYDDHFSEQKLLTLYQVTQDNIKHYQKAYQLHQRIYQAKFKVPMQKYDLKVPLVKSDIKYSVAQHQKMVLASLAPMGKEYNDIAQKAFAENWVDFATYPGKATGAYSIDDTYGLSKKLILMNDFQDIYSTMTLAHELGHSLHSYFSDQYQHLREAGYRIFVAEIASIFNELLLTDYILKTSDNKELKFEILQQAISEFGLSVYRQVEWSDYEYQVYQAIAKGKALSTFEALSKVYQNNALKYQKVKGEKITAQDAFWAIMVPHFYLDFYVYKYAIGQLCACIFFQRYQEKGQAALNDYINNFLKMGQKLEPLDLLKHNGIDLADPKTYQIGFNWYKDAITKWEEIAKTIFEKL